MKKIFFIFSFIIITNLFGNHELKILNKNMVKNLKYSVDYQISLDNGKFPNQEYINSLAIKEFQNNPGYDNYFIHFLLPGMKLGSGAYAVCNINKDDSFIESKINHFILINNKKYSSQLKIDGNGNYYLEDFPINETIKEAKKELNPLEKVGAKMIVNHYTENGKLIIKGYTNLPKNMELMITIQNEDLNYFAQNKIKINKNGNFISSPFSSKGYNLRNGRYTLEISSPYSNFQPDKEVKKILGKNGLILKSNITEKIDNHYLINYIEDIELF